MSQFNYNKNRIDEYIQNNKSEIKESVPVIIKG